MTKNTEAPEHALRQIIEIGVVFIADWTDEFVLMRGVTPLEAQEDTTPYFARVIGGVDGYKIAVLLAFIVAEHMRDGVLEIPSFLTDGIKFGAELETDDDPGHDGNVGTISDSVTIRILGKDGHPL